MKILLTGATGYIGKRLLPSLIEAGHEVVCLVRDKARFHAEDDLWPHVSLVEADLLKPETLSQIPADIDGAYYLVHSMSTSTDFGKLEQASAENFSQAMAQTQVQHVVYLSGMVNEEKLSRHLESRKKVEEILSAGNFHLSTLRAGIIIGSGSASFEIIRDLVEKLPVMVAPKWLDTLCQPIGVVDVIELLTKTLFQEETYDQDFDIGGPDVLTYKQMLMGYAKARGIRRSIITVPVMTPKLSSYWLYFVTSTSYKLAASLVDSMKVDVVCRDHELERLLQVKPMTYSESLERALSKVRDNLIVSSWKDSYISSGIQTQVNRKVEIPTYGCFVDRQTMPVSNREACIERIWQLGGKKGWYYGSWLWKIRGWLDKLSGGVGLRRGRTNARELHAGDALDFWRVLRAEKEEGRLLLFAEMKLPGEAWLEFRVQNQQLVQTATFRPKGVAGRLYWFSVLPFHLFIFKGMAKRLAAP